MVFAFYPAQIGKNFDDKKSSDKQRKSAMEL
jgi:hypothetical protein